MPLDTKFGEETPTNRDATALVAYIGSVLENPERAEAILTQLNGLGVLDRAKFNQAEIDRIKGILGGYLKQTDALSKKMKPGEKGRDLTVVHSLAKLQQDTQKALVGTFAYHIAELTFPGMRDHLAGTGIYERFSGLGVGEIENISKTQPDLEEVLSQYAPRAN